MTGGMDDVNIAQMLVAYLKGYINLCIFADNRGFQGTTTQLGPEQVFDTVQRWTRFITMAEKLELNTSQLSYFFEITVVTGIVKKHVSFRSPEEIRMGIQRAHAMDRALP